jgi:hypothetical protein
MHAPPLKPVRLLNSGLWFLKIPSELKSLSLSRSAYSRQVAKVFTNLADWIGESESIDAEVDRAENPTRWLKAGSVVISFGHVPETFLCRTR